MDFLRRDANSQPQTTARANGPQSTSLNTHNHDGIKKESESRVPEKWLRIVFVFLLFSGTVLLISIATLFYIGKDKEAKFVDTQKNQAVFLTNGQVYFGKVTGITDDYINLINIYYLNSPQSADDKKQEQASFSLVKLGCELHGPTDQMIINRDQVSFWENLTTEGKVAKAIKQFESQNPNGQNCSDTTNSVQQSQSNPATTTEATKKQ